MGNSTTRHGLEDIIAGLQIEKITEANGIVGNVRNKYVWSSALDDNDQLYVGIMNANFQEANVTDFVWSILKAPFGQKIDAITDALLRQWSGTPIFEHEGAQIYRQTSGTTASRAVGGTGTAQPFDMLLQTDPDFVGFRKMINYQGIIYAGSTNGPSGPYDGEPYDFEELYEANVGAKVSRDGREKNGYYP